MGQLKFLIKIIFIEDWGLNGFSNKLHESREKKKIKSILMMILFMMSLCCYLIMTYSVLLRSKLEASNNEDVSLKIANIIVSVAVCLLTMYKTERGFFNVNNNSILMTLPISIRKIVLSKISSLLIASYFLVVICIIPSASIYYYHNSTYGILYSILVFICIVFTPFLPMTIGFFIGMTIKSFRGKNSKKGRGIIILTSILLIIMMILSIRVDNLLRVIIDQCAVITEKITLYYKLAQYFSDAITKFKVIQLIKYIVIQIISVIFLYKILIKYFKNINYWFIEK